MHSFVLFINQGMGSFLNVQRAKRLPKRIARVIVMLYARILCFLFAMVSTIGNVVEAAPQAQAKTT